MTINKKALEKALKKAKTLKVSRNTKKAVMFISDKEIISPIGNGFAVIKLDKAFTGDIPEKAYLLDELLKVVSLCKGETIEIVGNKIVDNYRIFARVFSITQFAGAYLETGKNQYRGDSVTENMISHVSPVEVQNCLMSTSINQNSRFACGVYFDFKVKDSVEAVTIVSTDGKRLTAIEKEPDDIVGFEEKSYMIGSEYIDPFKKTGILSVWFNEKFSCVQTEEMLVMAPYLDSSYFPPYEKVIPEKVGYYYWTIDKAHLLDELKTVKKLAVKDVKAIKITGTSLLYSAAGTSFESTLEVDTNFNDGLLYVNYSYLLDFLEANKDLNKFSMSFDSVSDTIMIDNNNIKYIVMPMNKPEGEE